MKQFQIISRPRHLRYIYFVSEDYAYDKLFDLIYLNLKSWGGRYNPIIPVSNNVISEKYIALLRNYDPDYVYYSEKVDPEIIKELRVFNSCNYCKLDNDPRRSDIKGVDAFYFLNNYDTKSQVITTNDLWKSNSPLLDYYKLNYGIESATYVHEYEIGKHYPQIIINPDNLSTLNQVLHQEKPIIKSALSRNNLNTRILRTQKNTHYTDFEIVIAKDKSSTSDLFYFWNRLLYEGRDVLYITIEELNILSQDKFFGGNLYDLSVDQPINVVSMTINKVEIQDLIENKLRPIAHIRTFQFKDILDFPYEIIDANGLYDRDYGETFKTQTLITNNGLFYLPKLSFTNEVGFYPQKWAVDIEIKKVGENSFRNELKFPDKTETRHIIKTVDGRINKNRDVSIFIHNQQVFTDNLEINIPEFNELIRQLIIRPVVHGEGVNTKYIHVGPHDASNKLSAFLKSFNFNFSTIDDFFSDRFWVEIFEELITNEKIAGDSISFNEIKSRLIDVFAKNGIELGKKEDTFKNEENLVLGLKETLKELCYYRVFLKGFKLKCPKCSSKFWYPINEVSEKITCKGCLENFELPIEPNFAYKLNDLIKYNIFQSKKNRDGNLTVIRTLVEIHNRSRKSFEYCPQINLFSIQNRNKPCSDIDIVCISDGKLIIGEAKHNSKEFSAESNKSLKSLAEIAKEIHPDIVVLACSENENDKLEKAKKSLIRIFNQWRYEPEIEIIHLNKPEYFSPGVQHKYFYF